MKYFVLSLCLGLSIGCIRATETASNEPKFKVGDCIIRKYELDYIPEKWEKDRKFIHRIVELGHNKYRTRVYSVEFDWIMDSDVNFNMNVFEYVKIECINELKNDKKGK